MIITRGQTKPLSLKNCTTNGILVTVYLLAAASNTAITPAGLVRSEITLKAELKRNKTVTQIVQDNMNVLGLFSAKNYGLRDWINGNKITIAAVGVVEDMICNVFVNFGGSINLKGQDELVVTMQCGFSAFGAAFSQANSFIQFDANMSMGYEDGLPQISSQVVQTNITSEKYYPGDHVGKIMFLNFDKDNITSQVINTLALTSDRLDMSMNFFNLMNRDRNVLLPQRMEERYTTTAYDPATLAFGYQAQFPQTFCLFASPDGNGVINNVTVDVSYAGANVAASQNYVVWQSFIVSKASIARAVRREQKHNAENFNSLPASVAAADGGDSGGSHAGVDISTVQVK